MNFAIVNIQIIIIDQEGVKGYRSGGQG